MWITFSGTLKKKKPFLLFGGFEFKPQGVYAPTPDSDNGRRLNISEEMHVSLERGLNLRHYCDNGNSLSLLNITEDFSVVSREKFDDMRVTYNNNFENLDILFIIQSTQQCNIA